MGLAGRMSGWTGRVQGHRVGTGTMSGEDKPTSSEYSLESIEKKIKCQSPALMSHQVRASIVSNALQKVGIGLGAGLLLSLTVFRRMSSYWIAPY